MGLILGLVMLLVFALVGAAILQLVVQLVTGIDASIGNCLMAIILSAVLSWVIVTGLVMTGLFQGNSAFALPVLGFFVQIFVYSRVIRGRRGNTMSLGMAALVSILQSIANFALLFGFTLLIANLS